MTKCPRCNIEKSEQSFKSIRGKTLKYCSDCRETSRKYMANYHCPCGKRKGICPTHGGSLLCLCGKRKALCPTHGGLSLCACGKQKSYCLIHGGESLCPCGIRKTLCQTHGGNSLCVCGKLRYLCPIHGGNSLCPCEKRKTHCLIHGGNSLCPCGRRKSDCKVCKDPIKLTIRNMINHSKYTDKQKNRYDANNVIDKYFIQSLIEESTLCFYCHIQMQFIENNETLCTIERRDNRIGHIKSNCVLACRKCNNSNIGHP
jgi:hypothetical protein